MKKIAGSLKLQLAQYREVENFTSFAADLDESTLRTFSRGQRLVELLKQDQYSPRTVAQQVTLIHAISTGAFDEHPVEAISALMQNFLEEVHFGPAKVLDEGKLNEANLDAVIKKILG